VIMWCKAIAVSHWWNQFPLLQQCSNNDFHSIVTTSCCNNVLFQIVTVCSDNDPRSCRLSSS
jgi:hypothetical protein